MWWFQGKSFAGRIQPLTAFLPDFLNPGFFVSAFFASGCFASAVLVAVSLARRNALNWAIRSRTSRLLARYSIMALAPSLARSSFLIFASARALVSVGPAS